MDFTSSVPTVFISYSYDDDSHVKWVRHLSETLRISGIDVVLDQWDLRPGEDVTQFMEHRIAESDRVLMVCTNAYVQKANSGKGGVGYEKMIVSSELLSNLDSRKFIPIVRHNPADEKTPTCLGSRKYIDFEYDDAYQVSVDSLLRELYGLPPVEKPPLGTSPFSPPPVTPQVETAMAMEKAPFPTQSSAFADGWFDRESLYADAGFKRVGTGVKMEVRCSLTRPIETYAPSKLLEAARKAEIKTFGWPIGVIIDTRQEFCPKPREDGIFAELEIPDRKSFDYWAIRSNGDFFLSKSIFEDSRNPSAIFFDTRIIRTTEVLLYLHSLYSNLIKIDGHEIQLHLGYQGLRNRQLLNANPNRLIFPKRTHSDVSDNFVTVPISEIENNLVSYVSQLTSPLFELFDFESFSDQVYADIVTRYSRGEIA